MSLFLKGEQGDSRTSLYGLLNYPDKVLLAKDSLGRVGDKVQGIIWVHTNNTARFEKVKDTKK